MHAKSLFLVFGFLLSAHMAVAQEDAIEKMKEEVRARAAQISKMEREKRDKEKLCKQANGDLKTACKEYLEKEKKDKEAVKRLAEIRANASISGCPEGEVAVSGRATGSGSIYAYVKVRVTNPYSFPLDIEDASGVVVQNLCPHGAITLFRARDYWEDGDYTSFHWTAKGIFPDGSLGTADSWTYTLSRYDVSNGRKVQTYSWTVQLQKLWR